MRSIDIERLKDIQQVIQAMAQGDFSLRVARTAEDDAIETISVVLNMMGEEMKETLKFYSDMRRRSSQNEHIHMVFILDNNYKILFVTNNVNMILGYEATELINKSFSTILSENYIELWRLVGSKILFSERYNKQHEMILRSKNNIERAYSCGVVSIYDKIAKAQYIMIDSYQPLLRSKMLEDIKKQLTESDTIKSKKKLPNTLLRPKDRYALQNIYNYILKNLDKPLPHLKDLAHEYAINEFKLKYGFKKLYGTSVFRFCKQERMKKARLLIENTNLSMGEIAKICGYKSQTHFSKDFSAYFEIAPSKIRKA
ncbi:helix-turn-helix domain-containing protein [Aequorivita marisscotiae]|uniref:Helix-turn-helix domain-containing protein n=1 Tax=Aequorivita marisscotiae TaxID=3040348 RepID=A0ABY8KT11_9FLAO|nr:helix-turn-helix domain-containing protein [Aequorivita sp. Ant34-E75]WGF92177.1 helix-turn-helix domain-containing protein [Aequorivita sp. Ant34-E75]